MRVVADGPNSWLPDLKPDADLVALLHGCGEEGEGWVMQGTGASLQVACIPGRGSVPLTRYAEAAAYPHMLARGMHAGRR